MSYLPEAEPHAPKMAETEVSMSLSPGAAELLSQTCIGEIMRRLKAGVVSDLTARRQTRVVNALLSIWITKNYRELLEQRYFDQAAP